MAEALSLDPGSSENHDRLPVSTKIFYGLGTALDMWGLWLYPGVAFGVFVIYLGVDARLVGLALTLIRVYDAISDPLAGWISDNFRSRFGRRRPFILVFGVLCGLGLPSLFLVSPHWASIQFFHKSAIFWYMMISSMIYIPIFSCFTVPYNSLANELTPDYEERTSLLTYRSAIQKLFEVGNFYALRFTNLAFFLLPVTGKKNTLLGMQVYSVILGVMMAIFAIIIFLKVKEPYYDKIVKQNTAKISILASFGETLRCQPFRMLVCMGGAFTLGTSMVGNLGYLTTVYYVCRGNTVDADNWNFWMGIAGMIGGFIGAPALNAVAHRIGKRRAVVVAALFGIVGFGGGSWFLYTPQIQWLQTIASGLMAFCSASLWMLAGSIGADVIDYDELNTGKRREGSFTGFSQYVFKLGNSAGGMLAGYVIYWAGINTSVAVQSAHSLTWMRVALGGVPVAGLLLVIVFVLRIPLTKQVCEEIRAKLEARRGKV
jgi:GPH family glycoside/pentoside/hexuronide:cation symporter